MQQHQDRQDTTHMPQHGSRLSINGDLGGFGSAFHSSKPSIGSLRERQGNPQMTPINTTRVNHNMQGLADSQTSATAYDMNFTPLLPSQLLMGSPFQPGSPAGFQTPSFQPLPALQQQNSHGHGHNQASILSSPLQSQTMSPGAFHNILSPTGLGSPTGFSAFPYGSPNGSNNLNVTMGGSMGMGSGLTSGTSRTVYLGNIPADTPAEEILNHVRSGQIESVRLLPDKNCAFISFVDSNSAVHFHSDAILKKLSIKGQDVKIGWGKPSQVPSSVAIAIQQSGASRNVYLGNLPADITEEELRNELGQFGPIDTIKLVREKAIGFVHFLSIGNAIKAVNQLPQETKWQPPRRVFYGKDRCAYVSKTQQQNAAQYLGIAPGYAHVLNAADRDFISNALAQQSVAAAAVATAAGGANNLGNRTVYLGNIHPETTTEEICNVVRGGLLHHVRYIPDKHICFVTFIDPTAAASFFAHSNVSGLMIHNRRLKIGWGKHSGALPPAIALAVSGGASRNVYIGNIDESWTEERLRQDFSEYGEIELINTLREKSCAFVNFTNIQNAIKAIEAIRGKDEYKRFKINFGKDRCGNQPRQANNHNNNVNGHTQGILNGMMSPTPANGVLNNGRSSNGTPSTGSSNQMSNGVIGSPNAANGVHSQQNPLTAYLNQVSYQQNHDQFGSLSPQLYATGEMTNGINHQHQPQPSISAQSGSSMGRQTLEPPSSQGYYANHGASNSFSVTTGAPTVDGLLAPSTLSAKAQHNRATSLPAFGQGPFGGYHSHNPSSTHSSGLGSLGGGFGSGLGSLGPSSYGLAINQGDVGLPRWAEEEIST